MFRHLLSALLLNCAVLSAMAPASRHRHCYWLHIATEQRQMSGVSLQQPSYCPGLQANAVTRLLRYLQYTHVGTRLVTYRHCPEPCQQNPCRNQVGVRAASPVNVCSHIFRAVCLHHPVDGGEVQAACSNVGCEQHTAPTAAAGGIEGFKHTQTLALRVKRGKREAAA